MVTVPPVIPDTNPVLDPTVAMPVAELDQVPPDTALVRVIVNAGQTFTKPDIAASGFTVTTFDTAQPDASV